MKFEDMQKRGQLKSELILFQELKQTFPNFDIHTLIGYFDIQTLIGKYKG